MKKYSTFTLNKAAIIQYFLHDSASGSYPAKLIKKNNLNSATIKQSLLVPWHREVIVSLENNSSQTATDHNVTSQLQLQLNFALSKAKFSKTHWSSHTINKYTVARHEGAKANSSYLGLSASWKGNFRINLNETRKERKKYEKTDTVTWRGKLENIRKSRQCAATTR